MNGFKNFFFIALGAAILAAFFALPGPVFAQDVFAFPTKPFQKEVIIKFDAGRREGFGSFSIPSRKRMVIEHVSARIVLPGGQKLFESRIETLQAAGGAVGYHYLTTSSEGNYLGDDFFSISHSMRLYAVGAVKFAFFRTDSTTTGVVNVAVSGFLVSY
jgi:hypothetical protein